MNYWMFTVMYDEVPNHWPTLISTGLAAQHYPHARARNSEFEGRRQFVSLSYSDHS
jgi:hypothetical protein